MFKRDIRLRKEYIMNKALEEKEKKKQEKRILIKECLENGKKLPDDLKNETGLVKDLLFNEKIELETSFDSEYSQVGKENPKVLITTSRDPSIKLQRFAKDLKLIIPNSQKANRGSYIMKDFVESARKSGVTDIIVLHESNGKPSGMFVSHLPLGPTAFFSLSNIVSKDEISEGKKISEAYPHLVFDGFQTKLGARVTEILKHLFPVPKEDTKRIVSFRNRNDFIGFRNHICSRCDIEGTSKKQIVLTETGPRFDMKLYSIKLGTLDLEDGQVEWILRPFMNTAEKKTYL